MKAAPATFVINFGGEILRRGFWLYAWEVNSPDRPPVYYVGRTGDSSSINAQSPFNRMSQHLGINPSARQLRGHLEKRGVDPERCAFRLVAHGPVLPEESTRDGHRLSRDQVAAYEKALAELMMAAGLDVMNTVNCRMKLNEKEFKRIRSAFAAQFPALNTLVDGTSASLKTRLEQAR